MLQALLSGLMVGGVYGLFSMGFSLAFGVMRIVNFAHGSMVMLAMYIGFLCFNSFGIDPLAAVPIAGIAIAALGVIVYVAFYERFVGQATLQQLLVGISVALILQVLAEIFFSPDTRAIQVGWAMRYLVVGSIFLSYAQVAAFGVAVVTAIIVDLVLKRTPWGQKVRAVADDSETAELVGIDTRRINIGAFALATGLAGVTGAVLIAYYPVNPTVGFSLMPIALIATVVGGLGSVLGAFIGGILCGLIEQITSALWVPALQDLPLYVLLLAFLAWRPYGLFGRASAH